LIDHSENHRKAQQARCAIAIIDGERAGLTGKRVVGLHSGGPWSGDLSNHTLFNRARKSHW